MLSAFLGITQINSYVPTQYIFLIQEVFRVFVLNRAKVNMSRQLILFIKVCGILGASATCLKHI